MPCTTHHICECKSKRLAGAERRVKELEAERNEARAKVWDEVIEWAKAMTDRGLHLKNKHFAPYFQIYDEAQCRAAALHARTKPIENKGSVDRNTDTCSGCGVGHDYEAHDDDSAKRGEACAHSPVKTKCPDCYDDTGGK